jgi:hypothetical protein
MVRRLLTKPIWWWERNRSYAIRKRYQKLPPLPVRNGRHHYVVLTTPDALNDAVWTAWSWYRYLQPRNFDLQLAVDGTLRNSAIAIVQQLFPGISIYEVKPLLAPLCEQWPQLTTFLHEYPLGRKLGLLLALSQRHSFLFSDHDVLAFNSPVELLSFTEKNMPCYILEERDGNCDPEIVERCKQLQLDYLSKFNSGLLYLPQHSLSIGLAAKLLSSWHPPSTSWFTEQTILSVLLCAAKAKPLPGDRYVVSGRRQFYWQKDVDYRAIAARHFTGTVRHVMYGTGMPVILRAARVDSGAGSKRSR